jgi:hypothetical protein
VVQEMLGHCSIVLTADTYTSFLPEVARTAAEKTAAHVLRAAGVIPGTSMSVSSPPPPSQTAGKGQTEHPPSRRHQQLRIEAGPALPACGLAPDARKEAAYGLESRPLESRPQDGLSPAPGKIARVVGWACLHRSG